MRGELKYHEPLAPHTSWHIGGPADRYYRPADLEDLQEFLMTLPKEEPLIWLGLGSNVLIADQGVRGTVIHTQSKLAKLLQNEEGLIYAEAGVPCAKVAKFCAKHGLAGGEFFAGIPGTIGGALRMNAGAFGGETWPNVVKVEVINRKGDKLIRMPSEYQIGYRSVKGPLDQKEEWFVAGYFHFAKGNVAETEDRIKHLLRKRSETQPIGLFNCGSVFQNPPDHYAAQLIESVHLKGFKIGNAQISEKHANFIINLGDARAEDVLQLINHIIETVWQAHKIRLQTEVRLIGF